MQNYVTTGKVKVVFKDFSFLGPDSTTDAEYARAAGVDRILHMGTTLFNREPQENRLSVADNIAFVLKVTGSVSGIDVKKVTAAVTKIKPHMIQSLTRIKMKARVSAFKQRRPRLGTQMIAGAYPYATFQRQLTRFQNNLSKRS